MTQLLMPRQKLQREFALDPSLVLYLPLYELDGASIMSRDHYGHLCAVTEALWTPQGRSFDGTNDLVTLPQAVSQRLTGATGATLIMWLTLSAIKLQYAFYLANAAAAVRLGVYYSAGQSFVVGVRSATEGTAQSASMSAIGNPTTPTFHAVVIDLPNQSITLYRDTYSTVTSGLAFSNSTFQDSTHATINYLGTEGTNYLNGTLGEVLFCNRIFTSAEVLNIRQAMMWRYV